MSQRKFEREAHRRRDAERRSRSTTRRHAGLAVGAVGTAVLFAPSAAGAATNFEVDRLTDAAPVAGACTAAAGDCTLREAIAEANALAGADTISFAPGLNGTIRLTEGQLVISQELTITGPGASQVSVSGDKDSSGDASAGDSRVFDLTSGRVTMSGLTLTGGDGSTGGGVDTAGPGGAIRSSTNLTLTDCVITGNEAASGGGVSTATGSPTTLDSTRLTDNHATDGYGGSVDSRGPMQVVDSVISGSTATQDGGGIANRGKYLGVIDSTISGNDAQDGGGVMVDASATKYAEFHESTISGNTATGNGGGIDFQGEIGDGDGGGEGESDPGALVSNSTLAGNEANLGGGIHAGEEEDIAERQARQNRVVGDAELNVENTTVATNTSATSGGGIALEDNATNSGTVGLSSTIVGDNLAGTANKDLSTTSDTFASEHSLIETPGTAALTQDATKPTITGQDPQLGVLTNNGGTTQTKLPSTSSPALDKGTDNDLTEEQRHTARTIDLATANATGGDGTDIGAVEISSLPTQGTTTSTPRPVTPSATPTICGRRAISLVRADVRGNKVKLTGLVGAALFGKKVTIQTDPKGARNSAFTRTTTVTASRTGAFTATVAKPKRSDFVSIRYRAVSGSAKSPTLKLPQSLTSRSVKSAKNTITVKGKVKKSVLGKRNKVKIRRLVCGRYRTVGTAKPDTNGNYSVRFGSTQLRGVAFYRAESKVLRKPGSKVYVIQYARAIAIRTTDQTG